MSQYRSDSRGFADLLRTKKRNFAIRKTLMVLHFLVPKIIALLLLVAERFSTSLAIPLCYRAALLDHQRSPQTLHTDLLMHRSATNVPR